jgi:hypothetical protein
MTERRSKFERLGSFNPEACPTEEDSKVPYYDVRRVTAPRDANVVFQRIVAAIRVAVAFLFVATVIWLFLSMHFAYARDDGRYANAPLKSWFDQLASGKGLCCSFADGTQIDDVDWDTRDGRYRVRLNGEWIVVPESALVQEPNRFGPAVVWPYLDADGATQIRCFLPGAGT